MRLLLGDSPSASLPSAVLFRLPCCCALVAGDSSAAAELIEAIVFNVVDDAEVEDVADWSVLLMSTHGLSSPLATWIMDPLSACGMAV